MQLLNSSPALALRCGANENALCSALVMVATVAMAMMAITAAATREATLPRWGNKMTTCDSDRARVYAADNAGASTTAEQLACTWAALWGRIGARGLLGSLKKSGGRRGEHDQQWKTHLSPISPNPLGLSGTVVKADIDARDVGPSEVGAHR